MKDEVLEALRTQLRADRQGCGNNCLRAESRYWRLIDAEIVPAFGNRRAAEITRTEVREWSERLAEVKPVVANRAFAVMRRLYEWALGRDLVQSSPFVGIHKPAAEVARDRVLSDNEIQAVFSALRLERPIIAGLWELLFYSAVRPGTALAARWSRIDLAVTTFSLAGGPVAQPRTPTETSSALRSLSSASGRRPASMTSRCATSGRTVATGLGRLKATAVTISRVLSEFTESVATPGQRRDAGSRVGGGKPVWHRRSLLERE